MAFKVVDILGISLLVDYGQIFRDSGVDVELVVNPAPMGASEDQIIDAVGDADAVVTQTTFQPFSRKMSRAEIPRRRSRFFESRRERAFPIDTARLRFL